MKKALLLIFSVLFVFQMTFSQDEAGLLRFPAIYEDVVIFSKSGDLYSVPASGGVARKLTNHVGYEIFPRISPDGKYVAFTGEYDGNREVYVMPVEGGTPKRLTFTATLSRDDITDRMGPDNIVMTWTPDSKYIVYRSRRYSFNSFRGQLFKVSVEGGLSEEIPLTDGGFCSFSPDGKKLAFNKIFREFRTWKYYRGGMADEIRVFDFETKEITKITDNQSQDIIPMWSGNEIYYLSDRDRTMNLFCYNRETKETTKVTEFTDYDIKFPSVNKDKIVFEKGGHLFIFDTETKEHKKIAIRISDDFLSGRDILKDASKFITDYDISTDGSRLIFSARGDLFSVPAEKGVTYNLSQTSGVNERDVRYSPDGKYIAYISDKSGEYELYIQSTDLSKKAVQLTEDADTYYYEFKWSPDSKKIAWSDREFRLRCIDIESKKISLVHQSKVWELRDFNWSPDSKWIAFSRYIPRSDMKIVRVYNTETEEAKDITQGWYDANSPAFSDNGKYLFFASSRDFNPIYSRTEWNVAYRDMERIYLVTLTNKTKSPFEPENPSLAPEKADKDEGGDKKKDKKKKDEEDKITVQIDFEEIENRIVALPVDPGNYGKFHCIKDHLYYRYVKESDGSKGINMYDLDKKKETELIKKADFRISSDKKKMVIKKGEKFAVIDLPTKKIDLDKYADLSEMKVKVDLKAEWQHIFDEAWRQMRDFFYVENMHGVDWPAMKEKYGALLPYVKHRADLTYIIGEMIGELNIGHAYVAGGDFEKPERINQGLLGAKVSKDESGYYRIEEILPSQNWNKERRNPLTEVGVQADEGDFIIELNGNSTRNMSNIYEFLAGKAGAETEITLSNTPDEKDTWKEVIEPIKDESELYYYKWISDNIKQVSEATNDQVGYIHIRDMGKTGLNDFMTQFYPQLNKKALIIDDRGNGGGNVSPMLIERLRRELTRSRMRRNSEIPYQVPYQMMLGPKVLLMNEYSASDGDLFPYSFKRHNLGKTIGKRSWGGVVGIRGPIKFIDGGSMYKPEFASFSPDESKWIIEGYGVEPDIVVENNPYEEYQGRDAQLEKAIEVILEELKNYEGLPEIPEPPDKTK